MRGRRGRAGRPPCDRLPRFTFFYLRSQGADSNTLSTPGNSAGTASCQAVERARWSRVWVRQAHMWPPLWPRVALPVHIHIYMQIYIERQTYIFIFFTESL